MSHVSCVSVCMRVHVRACVRLCHQSAEIGRSLSPAMFTVLSTLKVAAFPIFIRIFLPACAPTVSRILFAEHHLDSVTIFRDFLALLFVSAVAAATPPQRSHLRSDLVGFSLSDDSSSASLKTTNSSGRGLWRRIH